MKECPSNTKKYEAKKLCLYECNAELFEYNNICYDDCPNGKYRIFINRNKCVDEVPKEYFLDINDNIYKKCFSRCEKCSQAGNEENNNCEKCIDGYSFLIDSFAKPKNCYENCDNFYYFDANKNYKCVNTCPSGFGKLISPKNKCIDNCNKDGEYIYEYENQCLLNCPDNLKIDYITKHCLASCNPNQFECELICYNEFPIDNDILFPNIYEYNKTCYKKCPFNTKLYLEKKRYIDECLEMQFEYDNICYDSCDLVSNGQKVICEFITKFPPNNSLSYFDELIQNVKVSLISGFNTTLIDNGNDYIVTLDKKAYTFTNTKNQKNQINDNVSTIDLGKCEDKLKEVYNISIDDSLYLLKIDYLIDNILKIEYEVYYNFSINNLTKLDLANCKGIKIDISIPKNIPVNELDKYNQSSGFYNDICYTFTADGGTDKSLEDRRSSYKNNDTMFICEENCVFTNYNNESKKATCSCYAKLKLPLVSEIKIDKKSLFSNFKDIRNIGNFKMLSCIKLFLNKNNISLTLL